VQDGAEGPKARLQLIPGGGHGQAGAPGGHDHTRPPRQDASKPSPESQRIAALRGSIGKLETSFFRAPPAYLSLGLPEVERHLPGPGLTCGVLHEIVPSAYGDGPAALGFLLAMAALAQKARAGLAVLVTQQRSIAPWGAPYGHGLWQHGLDPARLLLVEACTDKEALWAIEETLRSRMRAAVVMGALGRDLDLTASRRLNLAAAELSTPLLLLRSHNVTGASAAATRWRVGSHPAGRDSLGATDRPRWCVRLERCRNGRPGQWFFEWCHVAHRLRVVEGMADPSAAQSASLRAAG
jgi:protein ImuA